MAQPHISYSALHRHQLCPADYGFTYEEKRRGGRGPRMIRGTAVHDSAGHNLKQKVKSYVDLRTSEVVDVARESVVGGFAGSVILEPEEMGVGLRLLRSRTIDVAVKMSRSFHLEAAPHIRPLLVEQSIRVRPAHKVFPIDIVGRIDLVTRDGGVRDIKTKVAMPPAGAEHLDQQLTMYAMLFEAKYGKLPGYVGHDIVFKKESVGSRAYHELRCSRRSRQDITDMIARLNVTWAAIVAGNFPPTDPTAWNCSPRWCAHWDTCPYVSGIRRRMP